jgi:hypothetical protein
MQIHPLAYIVKLNIEMSMAELLAKISSSNNNISHFLAPASDALPQNNLVATQLSKTFGVSKDVSWRAGSGIYSSGGERGGDIMLNAKQEVSIQVERRKSLAASWKEDGGSIEEFRRGVEDDERPLREDDRRRERREERERATRDKMGGVERGMGVFTNIWTSADAQETERGEGVSRRNIRA